MTNLKKHNTRDKAITILCNEYDKLNNIRTFEQRIIEAKKIAIKKILNNCYCCNCQDAVYDIETLNFF